MSVPDILAVVALALAVVDELQTQGRSLLGWAIVLLAVAFLWHLL